MADRTCPHCSRTFAYPSRLRRHLEGARACAPRIDTTDLTAEEQEKPHSCRFCGRRFTARSNLSVHIRTNCRVAGDAEELRLLYERTLEKQQAQERQLAAQQEQLSAVLRQAALAGAGREQAAPLPPITYIDARTYTQNNIVVNCFGSEATAHIAPADVRSLLDDALASTGAAERTALSALLKAATLIYNDPEHPENITCYIPERAGRRPPLAYAGAEDVMVHGEGGWEVRPHTLVLPPMVSKTVAMLFDKQPLEDATRYSEVMKALRANEAAFSSGKQMKTVLVRSRELLEQTLGGLPLAAAK